MTTVPHRELRYALALLLLAAATATFLTGVLADRLDLNQFALHRWAGYLLAGLVVVHVGMHWQFFLPRRRPRHPPSDAAAHTAVPPDAVDGRSREGLTRRAAIATVGGTAVGAAAGWLVKGQLSPPPYSGGDVGAFYHRASSLGLPSLLKGLISWGSRPAPYKQVSGPTIALPSAVPPSDLSVARALAQRRSLRSYRDRELSTQELSWIVYAATAITASGAYRTAPSAGALYPIETYVAVHRVDGIAAGLYHVDVRAQALERVRSGSVAGDLVLAGLGQDFLRNAPVVLVLTGLFQRSRWKYHERHYRYVCWEGGHIAQNVYLAAEAAGLGACVVGAFFDRTLNELLRIDGRHEAALGLVAVGAR
jgi:SagB-type dehydrogenase family enzyme